MLYIDFYYSCICASYTFIFYSTDLSGFFICYKNMFLHVLHVHSCVLVVLLANCHADTLIDSNS